MEWNERTHALDEFPFINADEIYIHTHILNVRLFVHATQVFPLHQWLYQNFSHACFVEYPPAQHCLNLDSTKHISTEGRQAGLIGRDGWGMVFGNGS